MMALEGVSFSHLRGRYAATRMKDRNERNALRENEVLDFERAHQ